MKTTNENICRPVKSKCLSELLNNNSASCQTESSHHLLLIQEIDDGIIILNDVYPTILQDKNNITVKGTILLTFSERIKINGTSFKVKVNTTQLEAHPPKTVAMTFLEHENKMSLPFLHKLNLENTNLIQNINEDLETHTILWWSTVGAMMTISTILILACLCKIMRPKKSNGHISADQLRDVISSMTVRNEAVSS